HFAEAWQLILSRHEILRTAFVETPQGQTLQMVVRQPVQSWHHEDWRDQQVDAQAAAFERYRREDRSRGFDFTQPPLMRMAMIQLAPEHHRSLWTHHHSVLDGWSLPILMDEVFQTYH